MSSPPDSVIVSYALLRAAAQDVVDNWQSGDLAASVTIMGDILKGTQDFDADPQVQTHIYEPAGERDDPQAGSRLVRVKTIGEVHAELREIVGEDPHGGEEYFTVAAAVAPQRQWPMGRVVTFAVTGGSEGHYVHVQQIDDGTRPVSQCLILAKTFAGFDAAWDLARRLARILGV